MANAIQNRRGHTPAPPEPLDGAENPIVTFKAAPLTVTVPFAGFGVLAFHDATE
jgi:hypothetical protein